MSHRNLSVSMIDQMQLKSQIKFDRSQIEFERSQTYIDGYISPETLPNDTALHLE